MLPYFLHEKYHQYMRRYNNALDSQLIRIGSPVDTDRSKSDQYYFFEYVVHVGGRVKHPDLFSERYNFVIAVSSGFVPKDEKYWKRYGNSDFAVGLKIHEIKADGLIAYQKRVQAKLFSHIIDERTTVLYQDIRVSFWERVCLIPFFYFSPFSLFSHFPYFPNISHFPPHFSLFSHFPIFTFSFSFSSFFSFFSFSPLSFTFSSFFSFFPLG